jgi:hypothetical protein
MTVCGIAIIIYIVFSYLIGIIFIPVLFEDLKTYGLQIMVIGTLVLIAPLSTPICIIGLLCFNTNKMLSDWVDRNELSQ